jgi:hypothetical protein
MIRPPINSPRRGTLNKHRKYIRRPKREGVTGLIEDGIKVDLRVLLSLLSLRWNSNVQDLSSIPDFVKSKHIHALLRLTPTFVTADTSSYIPPATDWSVDGRARVKRDTPMIATCPGLVSVGTWVCETPYAPLFSIISLKYGAMRSGVPGTI